MIKVNRSILASAAAATLVLGGGAVAQESPTAGDRPLSTQMLMQSNEGSLLAATLPPAAAPTNGSTASKTPNYSFYAVPEPEAKVLRKHDLISIVVQETSTYQASGDASGSKQADFDAKVDQWIKMNLATFSLHGTAQANNPVETKLEGTRDWKTQGAVDRADSETLRLEAEILDVKPNGTLVVQARKHIKNDEEEQTIILTGTCRVQDVDSSNSVLSTDLHDLDLKKVTTGVIRDNTKRGILPRLLDFVNPF